MYSKKNTIKRKKIENNNIENNKEVYSHKSPKSIYSKNYSTHRIDNKNVLNYVFLKEHYKNSKNNISKFYVKKRLKLLREKKLNQNQENDDYPKDYLQSITQERIKKKMIYTMNSPNSNSQSKVNEFDYSTNLSKESYGENTNNFIYNLSGYNTINNERIGINNTCSNFRNSNLQNGIKINKINYGINKYNYISKPKRTNINIQSMINSKREKLKNNYLHKSNPDLNKFLNLINDTSRDNTYLDTYANKNLLTLNSKLNSNLNLDNKTLERHKSFVYDQYAQFKIRRELEYRKNEFEKMRSIEKKIKKYFVDNGVSFKNRELYHQSGIIIQSNFRAFILRKKLKLFLKYKDIIDVLEKIFYKKKYSCFGEFIEKIKIYNNNLEKEDTNPINIDEKLYKIQKLKIETISNFSIINKENNNSSEKLKEENKFLKIRLIELENQLKKFKKENEMFNNKYNNNILSENKMDINKIKENIENVSKELEEIKTSKKKNDNPGLYYNLKSYININNKNLRRQNTTNHVFDITDNKNTKEIKYLYLKYLITVRILKSNENKKFNFYKFITNMKIGQLNEIIQINKFKQMLKIIKNKLKQKVHLSFYQIFFIYLNLKAPKPFLYTKKI